MKSFMKEFKAFAMKGNVMDLAVAVVIGGAFGKIVSSLVDNIITPSIGLFMGGVDFSGYSYQVGAALALFKPLTTIKITSATIRKSTTDCTNFP